MRKRLIAAFTNVREPLSVCTLSLSYAFGTYVTRAAIFAAIRRLLMTTSVNLTMNSGELTNCFTMHSMIDFNISRKTVMKFVMHLCESLERQPLQRLLIGESTAG